MLSHELLADVSTGYRLLCIAAMSPIAVKKEASEDVDAVPVAETKAPSTSKKKGKKIASAVAEKKKVVAKTSQKEKKRASDVKSEKKRLHSDDDDSTKICKSKTKKEKISAACCKNGKSAVKERTKKN